MNDENMQNLRHRLCRGDVDALTDAQADALDKRIAALTPLDRLAHLCGWTFGDPSWARWFISTARDVGFKVSPD